MHYSKKQQEKLEAAKNTINAAWEIENELRAYLTSSKFAGFENNYVNPADVLRYLDQIKMVFMNSEL